MMYIDALDMSIYVKSLSVICMGNAWNIINIYNDIITFFQRTLAQFLSELFSKMGTLKLLF